MVLFTWIWFRKTYRKASRSRPIPRPVRPALESLEARQLPALVTWINPLGGDWDTGSNWSTGQVPNQNDQASIPQTGITVTHSLPIADRVGSLFSAAKLELSAGRLALDSPSILNALLLDGGTLAISGVLTVSSFKWTSGTLTGNGSVNVLSTLILAGPGNMVLDNVTLNNEGTGYWIGGNLIVKDGGAFNNLAGATFFDAASGYFGTTFANYGTFLVGPSQGASKVLEVFNEGTVDLQGNTLTTNQFVQISGTTHLSGGTLTATQGVKIKGGSLYGPGVINGIPISAGLVTVSSFGPSPGSGNSGQTGTGTPPVGTGSQTPVQATVSSQSVTVTAAGVGANANVLAGLPVTTPTSLQTGDAGTGISSGSGDSSKGKTAAAPQGSTAPLPAGLLGNGVIYSAPASGGGGGAAFSSQSPVFVFLDGNRGLVLNPVQEATAFLGRYFASVDDWGAREDDWQDSLFTLVEDWDLPTDRDQLVSLDLAEALLLGTKPRADLVPQKGSDHASVATLLPGDGTGEPSPTGLGQDVGQAQLKGLLTNPVAPAPRADELPTLPLDLSGPEEKGEVVASARGGLVLVGAGLLGWQGRKRRSARWRKKKRRSVTLRSLCS
jgi:hypothetical protein